MKKFVMLLISGCLAVMACPVIAAPTFFTDRALFDAATGGGLSFEGFEGQFENAPPSLVFSGFTVEETGGSNHLFQARDNVFMGAGITEGTGALGYEDNGDSIGTFFAFTSPVTAFGMDITVEGESSTVTIGGSVSDTLALTMGRPQFWGMIETAGIDTITFNASGAPIGVVFDAASFGEISVIPAPGAILLGGIGVALVGWLRRRRTL